MNKLNKKEAFWPLFYYLPQTPTDKLTCVLIYLISKLQTRLIIVQNIRLKIILQTFIFLTFVALVTLLPSWHFMPQVIIWFMDGQRLLELLLLCLILLDAVLCKLKQSNSALALGLAISNKLRYTFLLLLGIACISSCLAQSPRHAAIEVTTFIALCYLALFIARQFIENKEVFLQRLIYALWASILLYIASFYVGYITATVFRTPLNWPLPFNGFTNVRHFNQYQLWGLGLVCLPLLCFELKKNIRIWLQLALIFWWVMLFYSASRGVLLAWFLGLLGALAVYRITAWPFIRLQLIQAFTGFLGYLFLFKAIPAMLQHHLVTGTVIRETTNDRIDLWRQAIILIKDFPVFGVGPMHFAWHYPTNAHPHNSVIQLAAEWGLPAVLIIISIAAYAIKCWSKKFSANGLKELPKLDSELAIILFFSIIANTAYSLVDGVIVTPISQVLMFTVIGLMIGHYTYGDKSAPQNNSWFRPIFAGIVLVAMVWSTLPEVLQGLSGNEKGFSMGYSAAGPRFWREIK